MNETLVKVVKEYNQVSSRAPAMEKAEATTQGDQIKIIMSLRAPLQFVSGP